MSLLAAGAVPYIAWVLVPVLLAALPLAARGRALAPLSMVSAIGLVVFALLGGFAIGLLFLPGALCAVVGAIVRQPRRRAAETTSTGDVDTARPSVCEA